MVGGRHLAARTRANSFRIPTAGEANEVLHYHSVDSKAGPEDCQLFQMRSCTGFRGRRALAVLGAGHCSKKVQGTMMRAHNRPVQEHTLGF